MFFALIVLVATARTAFSSHVSVSNPLADQLPLIARTNAPYVWTMAPDTFTSLKSTSLDYSAPSLPGWLSFDPATQSFRGTPNDEDEGSPLVSVIASDSGDSASSSFTLLVTSNPEPPVNRPVTAQFYPSNPSLSSVFLLRNNSALATSNSALRIPPRWSFSIGFDWDTLGGADKAYYAGLQADGRQLPSWVNFNPRGITFDGVTPSLDDDSVPQVLSLALHAAEREGYTASVMPFDIVVAAHELSLTASTLPTINVTASTPFNVSFASDVDFAGVLVDDTAFSPEDLTSLSVDVSQYTWLSYSEQTRTLSGTPPASLSTNPSLPVVLVAAPNQTLHTSVSLAIVPSYFTADALSEVDLLRGDKLQYSLVVDFSNRTSSPVQKDDVVLSAAYDPTEAARYLTFDPASASLSGTIPQGSKSGFNASRIAVTFTAYSDVTHSTSHATLPIVLGTSADDQGEHAAQQHASRKAKLAIGLGVTGAVIGGLLLLGLLLSCFRRYARVEDSAVLGMGIEARRAYSQEDQRYYGIADPAGQEKGTATMSPFGAYVGPSDHVRHLDALPSFGEFGSPRSSGLISKAEFLNKLRATVRNVSQRYRRASSKFRGTPMIGSHARANLGVVARTLDANPFADSNTAEDIDSTNAPSRQSSLGNHSIPRRRADFAAPDPSRTPRIAGDTGLQRSASGRSDVSITPSVESVNGHLEEAVVHTAARARSTHSAKSVTGASYLSLPKSPQGGHPRLVPFTSASRPSSREGREIRSENRVSSQHVRVEHGAKASVGTTEALSRDVHYIQAFGEETVILDDPPSVSGSIAPGVDNVRDSSGTCPYSVPSAQFEGRDNFASTSQTVHIGERFIILVPINPLKNGQASQRTRVRQVSGNALPDFMATRDKGPTELSIVGVPQEEDLGTWKLGVYDSATGECVGLVNVVVERRNGRL